MLKLVLFILYMLLLTASFVLLKQLYSPLDTIPAVNDPPPGLTDPPRIFQNKRIKRSENDLLKLLSLSGPFGVYIFTGSRTAARRDACKVKGLDRSDAFQPLAHAEGFSLYGICKSPRARVGDVRYARISFLLQNFIG